MEEEKINEIKEKEIEELTDEEKNIIKGSPDLFKDDERYKDFFGEPETLESVKAQLKAKEEELAKLKDKDLNFGKVRDEKKTLSQRLEAMEKEREEDKKKEFEGRKRRAFDEFAGNDEELKKKMEYFFINELKYEVSTEEEIKAKASKAWLLATGGKGESINPISRANNFYSSEGIPRQEKSFADTPEGIAKAKAMGFKFAANQPKK